ncbi:hypothetical protein L7F22_056091 [Adiantum nelumboides]|nr:hypothetical protein [Adiantum nelumboides]
MENKWKNYPSPDVKAAKLEAYQNLVKKTQYLLEKQQPKLKTMPEPEELVVETPKEQNGKVEEPHHKTKEPKLIVRDSEDAIDGIPYVEEEWPRQLWEKQPKLETMPTPEEFVVETPKEQTGKVEEPHHKTKEPKLIVRYSEDAMDGIPYVEEDWPRQLWEKVLFLVLIVFSGFCHWLVSLFWLVLYSGSDLVTFSVDSSSGFVLISVTGSGSNLVLVLDWLAVWLETGFVMLLAQSGSGPSARTQGSATQDPYIAASDSSSDFDIMKGYLMQQHLESSSQDMHVLDQQPGVSMFSRLKETLSRATRSKHATNEINEGGGEVDLPFNSQINPVLSESVHVSTPATTPIGFSKLTPSETLLPDGRSLTEVQVMERYILAARKKEIKSLCKAEQRRATLAKAPMTSANPLQSPELTTLKSQPIGSHIASGSKDTSNTSILDGVVLNVNWEYNLQTEKLTDPYTSYTYHVG